MKSRRWLGAEPDAACEYLSKRERRDKETTERNAEQRRGKPNCGSNSREQECQNNGEDEEKSSSVGH